MTKDGSQFICIQDEKIIGAFALNNKPKGRYEKGCWRQELSEGSYMVLHALAIDPEMHRQGTASEIIRFCVEQAATQGYRSIRLDVVPDNYPAKALAFCAKIATLSLPDNIEYACDYNNIRSLATLSFLNEDPRDLEKVKYSNNDQQAFFQLRSVVIALAEELEKTKPVEVGF